jgi:hypothetical protein
MRNGISQAMSKERRTNSPRAGFTLSPNGSELGWRPTRGGRPESESDTPVNIENRLYRDNGEEWRQRHSLTHWG